MKCKHMHKDDTENAVCNDCYLKGFEDGVVKGIISLVKILKGGEENGK